MVEFRFFAAGEESSAGEIVRWRVQAGDVVAAQQPLVDVETDKAVLELSAPVGGMIHDLFGSEGDKVPPGATLAIIEPGNSVGESEAEAFRHGAVPVVRAMSATGENPDLILLET